MTFDKLLKLINFLSTSALRSINEDASIIQLTYQDNPGVSQTLKCKIKKEKLESMNLNVQTHKRVCRYINVFFSLEISLENHHDKEV